MNLPIPNEEEVTKMQDLYEREVGIRISRNDAFEVLYRLTTLIYLTEYEPIRPLREQSAPPKALWQERLTERTSPKRKRGTYPRPSPAAEDVLTWYNCLSEQERNALE